MKDTHCDHDGDDRETANTGPSARWSVPRRTVLGTTAAVGVSALAGCSGFGASGGQPEAVTLTEEDSCDVCGMVIPNHPGPSSEIFYAENEPNDHANPARFDSTWEAFKFDFAREDWSREAFYVTDYSAVDYEITRDDDQQLISRHVGQETFVEAQSVTFVVGSEVVGTMGEDLIAFSDEAEAESFSEEHGGDLVGFDDVTPTMISQLGK